MIIAVISGVIITLIVLLKKQLLLGTSPFIAPIQTHLLVVETSS